jgi:hypothetical protein
MARRKPERSPLWAAEETIELLERHARRPSESTTEDIRPEANNENGSARVESTLQ